MKTDDILRQTKIDIYKCAIYSKSAYYSISMIDFFGKLQVKYKDKVLKLRDICKEYGYDSHEAKEYKSNNLICCTISSTCDKYRITEHINNINGLISIDIDKGKNPDLDIDKAKSDTISLPYVMLSETSCRGEGIFCIIPYNKDNDFKETWNALYEDFKDIGYIIDDCKDLVRLRVISYDDNILMRKEVDIYDKTSKIEHNSKSKDINNNEHTISNFNNTCYWDMTKSDLKDLVVAIYLLCNKFGYKSDDYNEWLLDGFRLATVPIEDVGRKLFHIISENSSNYKNSKDVDNKFNECLKKTNYNTSILGYYINRIKEYLGPEWRSRANDILKNKVINY